MNSAGRVGIASSRPLDQAGHTGPCLVVDNVSKRYEIYERPEDRLKQSVMPRLQKLIPTRLRWRTAYFKEFWALRDVSFSVERGEVLGILGRNGAGKSTLLQIIAGTSTPTAGSTAVHGKVAALLELGSGFAGDFTGRENVRMNASLLGLSPGEIDERFDDIAAFADIGEFIDQPVKTYSSGMMLRLAFAVQTAVDPEVLIVDEALAVGDARFQKKCFARLEQLQKAGTTILLVTHDSGTIVQCCTRAMILDNGQVFASGEPQSITREYHKLLFDTPPDASLKKIPHEKIPHEKIPHEEIPHEKILSHSADAEAIHSPKDLGTGDSPNGREVRYGTGDARILAVGLRDTSGAETRVAETQGVSEAYFRAAFTVPIAVPIAYGFIISNVRGVEIYGTKSGFFSTALQPESDNSVYECRLRFAVRLVPGRYFLSAALAYDDDRADGQFLDFRFDALEFEVVGRVRTFTTSLIDLDADLSHALVTR